jgi:beta-N-acetylhexosaminidase
MLVGTHLDATNGIVTSAATMFASTYAPGGMFLQGRTTARSATLKAEIAAIQHAARPGTSFLIALDQEGGQVQTLQGTDFPTIPSELTQATWARGALSDMTARWAGRLARIGVNLDLAPVADTVPATMVNTNPPIGMEQREFGSDPTAVAANVTLVVGQIQGAGVLTTLKHFPGLGRVQVNTDAATGAVDNTATVDDPFLGPFKAGIQAGSAAVMISLASYPKLDPNTIAAFSAPIVTGLLRQKLGFTGMIISDDLGSAGAVNSVPVGQRAVRFLQAGGDLALDNNSATAPEMINGLVAEATTSSAFAATLQAAATQVLQTKYNAGLLSCSPSPNPSAGATP